MKNKDTPEVFTRADTIYGISYVALAPEHKIVQNLIQANCLDDEKVEQIKKYAKTKR